MSRSSKHIFLVRHARPDFPGESPMFLGVLNPPLCAEGFDQAAKLAAALKDVPFNMAFSSDLKRAVQTADAVLSGRNIPLTQMPELREINPGICDGLSIREALEKYPYIKAAREQDIFGYRMPGGESFADLEERIWPVFCDIAHATTQNTLMVCHSGVNKVILRHILNYEKDKLFSIYQSHCGINVIAINEKRGFSVKAVNWVPSASTILE